MPDNQTLTAEQQKAIQEILKRYRQEADAIVAEHRQKVTNILEDLDRQKAEEIKNMIGQSDIKNPE